AVLVQALVPRPAHGPGRLAIAGMVAGHPPGLGRSWIVGRRAMPIDWRAYDATVRKGRLQRDALAVVRRAVTRLLQQVGRWRGRVTADRGCADVALCPWLPDVGGACVSRGKQSTKSRPAGGGGRGGPPRLSGTPPPRPP